MPDITVNVREKIAQVQGNPEIVSGNSDYSVIFDFDAEWDGYEHKTARFISVENGVPRFADVLFTGSTVSVPAVCQTCTLLIGVYAGEIRTTAPAVIPCVPCITDGQPVHPDPPPDVYDQLLALLMHLDVDERAPVHLTAVGNAFVTGAPIHTEQEE